MQKCFDIPYGEGPLRVYDAYPAASHNAPAVIHFHGGGLGGGEKKPHPYIDQLLSLGYAFYDCNYRLRSETVTPEMILEDCALAVAEIAKTLPKTAPIFLAGDSAGAWITMMLALRKELFLPVGFDYARITGFVFDDAMPLSDFGDEEKAPYITDLLFDPRSPISYAKAGEDYPPMYFSTFGASIPRFPEYVHLCVATLLRMGYGDRIVFGFYPALPHCGNFEKAPAEDGLIPYVKETDAFYRFALERRA